MPAPRLCASVFLSVSPPLKPSFVPTSGEASKDLKPAPPGTGVPGTVYQPGQLSLICLVTWAAPCPGVSAQPAGAGWVNLRVLQAPQSLLGCARPVLRPQCPSRNVWGGICDVQEFSVGQRPGAHSLVGDTTWACHRVPGCWRLAFRGIMCRPGSWARNRGPLGAPWAGAAGVCDPRVLSPLAVCFSGTLAGCEGLSGTAASCRACVTLWVVGSSGAPWVPRHQATLARHAEPWQPGGLAVVSSQGGGCTGWACRVRPSHPPPPPPPPTAAACVAELSCLSRGSLACVAARLTARPAPPRLGTASTPPRTAVFLPSLFALQ